MEDNKGILGRIYKITNSINSKVYIGQTIRTINQRWHGHKHDSLTRGRETAIANAIRKHGHENFQIQLIEDNIPYSELDFKEIEYIKQYNCISPNGYNISYGGQAYRNEDERKRMSDRVLGDKNPMYGAFGELNPFYGKKHTDETIEVLSKKGKAVWGNMTDEDYSKKLLRLDEMRLKMIELHGGGFAGKSHSEESKSRISNKLKGKVFSEEHNRKISENSTKKQRIVMLDKQGNFILEFESMSKACIYLKENNIHKNPKAGEISSACTKKRKTAYGHVWVYYKDYVEGNYTISKKYKRENNKIICLNNKMIFETFSSAGTFANTSGSSVWACCNKTQKTAGKLLDGTLLVWMYYEEYLEFNNISEKEAI